LSIQLDRIDFNHKDQSGTNDALNIRIDGSQLAPSWLLGGPKNVAAYALAPTLNQQLTIKATFSFTDLANPPPAGFVKVRARPVATTSKVLGAIASTNVQFPTAIGASPSVDIDLPLTGVTIWAKGIGKYDVSWIWEAQWSANGAWTYIAQSDHIIYVTLDLPALPWSQATDSQHATVWPWTRALDVACVWAKGVKITSSGVDGAAPKAVRKIEQHLYGLGDRATPPLTYDVIAVYAMSNTNAITLFAFSDFLTLVEGTLPTGRAPHVNCTDMAAALAALSNVLGCGLVLRRVMRDDEMFADFWTNPIVPVGGNRTQSARMQFSCHDITVRPATAAAADHVHDACLMIDRDHNPASSTPANYQLSKGLGLGSFPSAAPLRYVHRLLGTAHRADCSSHDLGLTSLGEPIGTEFASQVILSLWNQLRKKIGELSPPINLEQEQPAGELSPINLDGFYAFDRIESPAHLAVLKDLVIASAAFFYVAVPALDHKRRKRDHSLQISIGYAPTVRQARDALAWTLTQTAALPPPVPATEAKIGDAAFGSARRRSLYLVRGRALARIVSTGRDPLPLLPIARIVDTELQRRVNDTLRPQH
jgi:hypothetical protein